MTYDAAQIGNVYPRDDRDLVAKYGKLTAPFFQLQISNPSDSRILFQSSGVAAEEGYDLNGLIVSEVEWDENDCTADMMTLVVNNVDMLIHTTALFQEGNNIDLWMGYDGHQPDYMGRGIITNVEPDFPNLATPTIRVTAYDISYFMMEEGRAEVVPEGTQWWERRSVPASSQVDENQIVSNHIRDTAAQARAAQRAGARPDAVSINEDGGRLDASQVSATLRRLANSPTREGAAPTGPTTTQFRSISQPRGNRRNRGKVWRDKSDAEIAEAIFQSYGIVPYVQATGSAAQTRWRTATTQEVEVISSHVEDTQQQANNRADRIRNLQRQGRDITFEAQIPTETVNNDGPRLDLPLRPAQLFAVTTDNQIRTQVQGRRVTQKSGTTDWEFLKKLAEKHNFIVFVFFHHDSRRWIGYWGSKQNTPQYVEYVFKYNQTDDSTLSSFRPIISTRGQSTDIAMEFTNPSNHKEYRLQVSMSNVSRYSPEFRDQNGTTEIAEPLGSGPEVVLTINGQRTRVVPNKYFESIEEARLWLMAFWLRYAEEFCQADGETLIGLPELRARQRHTFTGTERFDGTYFITKATHRMATGQDYKTKFSGFRMVDILYGGAENDGQYMSVEEDDIGRLEGDSELLDNPFV